MMFKTDNPYTARILFTAVCLILTSFYSIAQFKDPPPLPAEIQGIMLQDSAHSFTVDTISITGNKKTKGYIILRELIIKSGNRIPAHELYERIRKSQSLVYNTSLFTSVIINAEFKNEDTIHLRIEVKEKWYLYPTPQFQLVDRNFNDWVKTHNADLDRVIYGAKFLHYNFSGRRDLLRIYLLNGYARNISFSYSAPYSNPALTEGFQVSAGYTQNREVSYKTSFNNKQLFFNNGEFVRTQFAAGGAYIMRRGYYQRHVVGVYVNHVNITDSIITKYNPAFFNSSKNKQTYPDFMYTYQYINADNVAYPLKGIIAYASVLKRGFGLKGGLNLTEAELGFSKFMPHGRDWFSSITLLSKLKIPFNLAYINQHALGYKELYLRGLEYYVVDGYAAALAKYTLRKKILSFNLPVPFKIKQLPHIPFSFYGKVYGDAGTSFNRKELNTHLNNRLLYTAGFGIDILTLYDINLKLEYSFNQLGGNGLFLHTKGGF